MPWTQKQMLRDANGDLIPQYWDVAEQEFKPLTGSDGANDVRLTGSNVEFGKKEEILSREIIRSTTGTSRAKPVWAKGALIELNVYNLVGHFDNNQGIRFSTFNRLSGGTGTGLRLRSPYLVNPGIIQHLWYPGGINLNDAESANADFMMSNTPLSEILAVGLEIQGNFADGEGIDCEVNVYWMR